MRVNIRKRSSTKAERIFSEILKKNHIPFKHREILNGREIDFLIGKYAVEIDGHHQESVRNDWIISLGYIPIHYTNHSIMNNLLAIEEDIKNKIKYGI